MKEWIERVSRKRLKVSIVFIPNSLYFQQNKSSARRESDVSSSFLLPSLLFDFPFFFFSLTSQLRIRELRSSSFFY